MTTISACPVDYLPNTQRSLTRTDTGSIIDFQRIRQNGSEVNGQTTITKSDTGEVTVNVTRTGPKGMVRSIEKTYTPEDIAAMKDVIKEKAGEIGQKLAENPVTLPNGRVLDGSFLLNISV